MNNKNVDVFFALVRAGLWEKETRLGGYKDIAFGDIYELAEEQSVLGLVAAGLDKVIDVKIPQEEILQFVGYTLQLEQQNIAMNHFVGDLVEKMRTVGIYTLLVKGQGIAQCYERPLWRQCGDIDFFLSKENYNKAKEFLLPLAQSSEKESVDSKHLAMEIESWIVELHGFLRCGLSSRIDKAMDEIKSEVLCNGDVRSWIDGKSQIFLLGVNCDILYVFTHLLKHFYKEGLGLRQVCDWCRLLWTYRESLNYGLLESRIRKMGLMSEWKAFGAFAVEYLGMPKEVMPLYSSDKRWKLKADRICAFILEVGNMGHNRDMSYYNSKPYLIRKTISLGRRCGDVIKHMRIFPLDSLRFFPYIIYNGMRSAVRGE